MLSLVRIILAWDYLLVCGGCFVTGLLCEECCFIEYNFLCAQGETKPKPKAKQKTLSERTNAWKKLAFDETKASKEGEEGEEEEEKEQDEEVEPEPSTEKRNYAKARKFGRLFKAGQVPADIMKMYNEQSLKQN